MRLFIVSGAGGGATREYHKFIELKTQDFYICIFTCLKFKQILEEKLMT